MVKILDCTTRDGGHDTNWFFDKKFIEELTFCMNKSQVTYYEIGYRNFTDKENKGKFFYCTPDILKEFQTNKQDLQIGIMVDTSRYNENDFPGAENDYANFIRIATHPDKIQKTLDIAYNLHNKGYKIFVQLMEIPNVKEEHYKILENWRHKNILESLYIADSYSTVKPEDIPSFFNKLKSIGYNSISFHAHNKHNLALENTLKAIELGAYSVDVTLNGMGNNLDAIELFKSINYTQKYYKELTYSKNCL